MVSNLFFTCYLQLYQLISIVNPHFSSTYCADSCAGRKSVIQCSDFHRSLHLVLRHLSCVCRRKFLQKTFIILCCFFSRSIAICFPTIHITLITGDKQVNLCRFWERKVKLRFVIEIAVCLINRKANITIFLSGSSIFKITSYLGVLYLPVNQTNQPLPPPPQRPLLFSPQWPVQQELRWVQHRLCHRQSGIWLLYGLRPESDNDPMDSGSDCESAAKGSKLDDFDIRKRNKLSLFILENPYYSIDL